MLQALTKNGTLVTLATLTKKEIESYKEESFFCPTCHNPVIIKAGPQVIPHFAHRSISNCLSKHQGESPYHERGKLLLYQWLKKQHLNVALEPYIPVIRQQPDLLITCNKVTKIAIEFQCARIPSNDIQQRNKGYRHANIKPIWILGANRLKWRSYQKLNIDQLTKQFIHRFSKASPLTLFFFCPQNKQLIHFQHIYFTQLNQAFGQVIFRHLRTLKFTDLFRNHTFSRRYLYDYWKKEKRFFRLRRRGRLYGQELAWHKWLYKRRLHFQHLPSIIHLPVSMQYQMKTPPWNWQSRLCIDVLAPLPVGKNISVKKCTLYLRHHFHHPKSFPLIQGIEHPIQQYFQLLEKVNILKAVSPRYYQKINPIVFPAHIEEALRQDEYIMNDLMIQAN